jgi:RimJ/RimL family protein N-acetyltransferase
MDHLLTGSRVRLMAFMPDDLPVLVRWYQDTEFLRLYDAEAAYPRTPKQLGEYIDEQQKSAKAFIFAIRLLDRDEMIGYAELDGINWAQRAGWISLAIGDSAQRGRGHGTEAMRLLLRFAFDELNLYRVQLTVFGYNDHAIQLYEKLGFQREGAFREFLHRTGQRHDMLLYGLLRREWEASQAAGNAKSAEDY